MARIVAQRRRNPMSLECAGGCNGGAGNEQSKHSGAVWESKRRFVEMPS
ncbi:MAG: hypothetical protein HUU30_03710 [Burkholderiaceae bacterium]|jgi:hypothetical protein|nr:hypothetical protein [Aquabacterium sp.]NUP84845.1 hypothetical protein [Burkholderiaceae bacterium]